MKTSHITQKGQGIPAMTGWLKNLARKITEIHLKLSANKEISQTLVTAIVVAVTGMLVSAADLPGGGLPFGVAAAACFASYKSLNIYFIPFIFIGMAIGFEGGTEARADMLAAALTVVVTLLIGRHIYKTRRKNKKATFAITPQGQRKAITAVTILAIANLLLFLLERTYYAFNPLEMVWKMVVTYGALHGFTLFYKSFDRKLTPLGIASTEGFWLSRSFVFAVMLCGAGSIMRKCGILEIDVEIIVFALFMLACLVSGYCSGVTKALASAGMMSGVLMCCGIIGSSVLPIVMVGTALCGFYKNRERPFTAIYVMAGTLAAVSLTNYHMEINSTMKMMILLCGVSLAFALIPKKLLKTIGKFFMAEIDFAEMVQGEALRENAGEEQYSGQVLQDRDEKTSYEAATQRTLERLVKSYMCIASIYSSDGSKNPVYTAFANQFKGMGDALCRIKTEIEKEARGTKAAALEKPPRFSLEVGQSTYSATNQISGDYPIIKELHDGRIIIAISDGMGKGSKAGHESRRMINTLINLLEGGFSVEQALRTINSVMAATSREMFATLDLAVFNRRTGLLKIYKAGAAATYIKSTSVQEMPGFLKSGRGRKAGVIKTVKIAALPLGVVPEIKLDSEDIKLKAGDQVLMVSDGVVDSARRRGTHGFDGENMPSREEKFGFVDRGKEMIYEEEWVKREYISISSTNQKVVADMMINKATENYGLREKDDMTVLAFRVI